MNCMGCGCSYQYCTCHLMPKLDKELMCHFCGTPHYSLGHINALMCVDCAVDLTTQDTTHCVRCSDELDFEDDFVCALCEFDAG